MLAIAPALWQAERMQATSPPLHRAGWRRVAPRQEEFPWQRTERFQPDLAFASPEYDSESLKIPVSAIIRA